MVSLSIGYPTLENQIRIIRSQKEGNPLDTLQTVTDAQNILDVQNYLSAIHMEDSVLAYAIELCEETRSHALVELGVSPRGVLALVRMARAHAVLRERNYVIPEDVQAVYRDVCAHRLVLYPQARVEGIGPDEILESILHKVKPQAPTME